MRLLYESYWTHDPSSLDFIVFMLAVAAAAVGLVFWPLQLRLWQVVRLRRQTRRAMDVGTGREAKQAAVGTALADALLSGQWSAFIQRWRDARGDVLHDRAPVRFGDVLGAGGLLPRLWTVPLLPAVPGVLLGLGILGTFLGLTQALPHAGTSFISDPTSVVGAPSADWRDSSSGAQSPGNPGPVHASVASIA